MMSRKRKFFYWLFKLSSVLVSCAFPIWAIYERYPLWVTEHGTSHSIGAGGILILAMIMFMCRKPIFVFARDHFKLKYAPPLIGLIVLLVVCYMLLYISSFLLDVIAILKMSIIGCSIGVALTFIAENCIRKENDENG